MNEEIGLLECLQKNESYNEESLQNFKFEEEGDGTANSKAEFKNFKKMFKHISECLFGTQYPSSKIL